MWPECQLRDVKEDTMINDCHGPPTIESGGGNMAFRHK